jgi:hypothetical protein
MMVEKIKNMKIKHKFNFYIFLLFVENKILFFFFYKKQY